MVGAAAMSTASGDATVGELTGDVKFRAASGSLSVRRLHGTVNAQTASGDVAVAAAVTGGVSVQTGSGDIEVGVEEGTAARLDLEHIRAECATTCGRPTGLPTVTKR